MRVQAIDRNIISTNKQLKTTTITSPIETSVKDASSGDVVAAQNIAFHGLFDHTPDLSKRFQYGMEALNENSLFIVTSDETDSNRKLRELSSKIPIPVTDTYTLVVKDEELKNNRSLDCNFAIFKQDKDYYVLPLGFIRSLLIRKPNEKFDAKKHCVYNGDIKRLNKNEVIETGESLSLFNDEKHKFIFQPPYNYNPDKAKKYLIHKTTTTTPGYIERFNKNSISTLTTASKTQNANKTKYYNFSDIGGLDDVITELRKFVIRPVRYPEVFENIRLNKGILLYGPPRCGKTLLGKALANEAELRFCYKNANEFKSGTVGSSEGSVRAIFTELTKEPGILFIDEFDAIAKSRDGSSNARYDDSLVNQLLGCMSDLEKSDTISFVIAATNKKDLLDNAMTASGRFGLHLNIPMPDEKALESIFNIHSKGKNFDDNVSLPEFIQHMKNCEFNGSDVAELITLGYFNALERLGINEKMDAGTFCTKDLQTIKIASDDLHKALKKITSQKFLG